MKSLFTGLTDKGMVRKANQDAYHIDPDGRFFIVADGMGGHAGGEEASRIAIETAHTYLEQHWDSEPDTKNLLAQALITANEAIVADASEHCFGVLWFKEKAETALMFRYVNSNTVKNWNGSISWIRSITT